MYIVHYTREGWNCQELRKKIFSTVQKQIVFLWYCKKSAASVISLAAVWQGQPILRMQLKPKSKPSGAGSIWKGGAAE